MNIYNLYLQRKSNVLLKQTEQTIDKVLDTKHKDEQWFLDFMDNLNEQSVRY
jgi:hypothetical protein